MRRSGSAMILAILAAGGAGSAAAAGGADQRLPDRRACRICLRLHEDERRDTPVARAVLLLDRRDRVAAALRRLCGRRDRRIGGQAPGQIGGIFRSAAVAKDDLAELRRAQAEAEVRCF